MFDEVGAQLMVRFIHTADWHLGMQAHFLPAEARSRFAEDRFSAVGAIGDLAREEACSFVVVAGDVFDSNHVDRQVIAKAVDELSSFTVPVFLLPANHDALDASSVYRSPAWLDRCPAGVTVLEELVAIPVGEGGAVEIGPDQARLALFRWIEGFYNSRRRHSTLGQRSPQRYEEMMTEHDPQTAVAV